MTCFASHFIKRVKRLIGFVRPVKENRYPQLFHKPGKILFLSISIVYAVTYYLLLFVQPFGHIIQHLLFSSSDEADVQKLVLNSVRVSSVLSNGRLAQLVRASC